MELIRGYTEFGTFGQLYDTQGVMLCRTVERRWLDNKPNESCIPEGVYNIHTFDGEKYSDTFALSGRGVSLRPTEACERYAILFHTANWPHELAGCIAPVTAFGVLSDQWAGLRSADAMARLRPYLERAVLVGEQLRVTGDRAL